MADKNLPPISLSVLGAELTAVRLEKLESFIATKLDRNRFLILEHEEQLQPMTTNYKALVTSLSNVRPLPGADRLQLATASGYTIIVSIDSRDGDPGLLITDGSQLSEAFCLAHSLYRKHPTTGETMGGYLEPSGRVRSLTLRGVESQALFLRLESLQIPSADRDQLAGLPDIRAAYSEAGLGSDGPASIDSLPGFPDFVRKYQTRAQRQAKEHNAINLGPKRPPCPIPKHYDTAQLREHSEHIATALQTPGAVAYFTEKLHGTSGRTGKVYVNQPLARWERAWNWLASRLRAPKQWACSPRHILETVSGTRNVQLGTRAGGEANAAYRVQIHDYFASRLRPGEIVYYEIVGYSAPGTPIMATHSLASVSTSELPAKQLKALRKEYGSGDGSIVYSYGCEPDGLTFSELEKFDVNVLGSGASIEADPLYRVFVYRMTREAIADDGRTPETLELTMSEIEARMSTLGWPGYVEMVPKLWFFELGKWGVLPEMVNAEMIIDKANKFSRGASSLDSSHPREGVCVRVDSPAHGGVAVKHKGFLFCVLEGVRANDPDFAGDPDDRDGAEDAA